MSSNVIDFRKWVRAVMRKFKGIADVQLVACDGAGQMDVPLPELYDLAELSDDRIIDGKRVGDIRAEQLARELRQHDIKFDDPTTDELRAGRVSSKRKAATSELGAAED